MIADQIDLYLSSQTSLLAGTSIAAYRVRLERFAHYIKDRAVTKLLCKNWLAHMLEKELVSRRTALVHYQAVTGLFNWLVEAGELESSPVPKLRRFVIPHKEPERMLQADVAAILNYCRDHGKADWFYATLCGWETALRLSDVATLLKSEIDHAQKLVRRLPQKTRRFGKVLEIPVSDALLCAMRDCPPYADGDQSYVSPKLAQLHKFDGHKTLSAQFGYIARRAGVDKSFHSLRHGRASQLMNKGVPISIVRGVTGQSLAVLQRYSHTSASEIRTAIG